jgi:hypothetical protein
MYDADIQSMDAAAKGARMGTSSEYRLVYDLYNINPDRVLHDRCDTNDSECFKAKS